MRRIINNTLKIIVLSICLGTFAACTSITSQNIRYVKPDQQLYINKGLENKSIDEMKSDQIGRIISADEHSIRIELVNKVKNYYNYSEKFVMIKVDDNTKILKTTLIPNDQKQQLKVDVKLSELEKDQLIFIWYKENKNVASKICIFDIK